MQKRLFDIVVSFCALIMFAPLLLILAAWIVISCGRPALYKGWRAGENGVAFQILKLRTMVLDAEHQGGAETPSDDPRITKIGKSLRHYKLDELPQFLNVLRGDMSIVGPRPEVLEEVCKYDNEEKMLLSIKPGITDWASIKFRHEDEMLRGATNPNEAYHKLIQPEKKRLGLQYARERTMKSDVFIIIKTILVCFVNCK